jgi:hypothetical protein
VVYAKDGLLHATVAAVTSTAGYFLALRLGFISLNPPVVHWMSAVLVIVAAMFVQRLGILLPTNVRIYFELRKDNPDMIKIQRFMKCYVKVVASQAILQFIIIFIIV